MIAGRGKRRTEYSGASHPELLGDNEHELTSLLLLDLDFGAASRGTAKE